MMTIDTEIAIAVSGINATDNPGPGTGVARSLKESETLPCRIAGLAYDALESGVYSEQLFDKSFMHSYPSAGETAFLERLFYIREAFGLDVVIPTLDTELPLYIKHRETLAMAGIHSLLPSQTQFALRGKEHLEPVAHMSGIRAPAQKVATTLDELAEAIKEIGLPVMVKGPFYRAFKAYSLEQAVNCFSQIVSEWGYLVIVQQMVQGEELNLVGVGDGFGGCPGLVAVRKMSSTWQGTLWSGVTVRQPGLAVAARQFVDSMKWQGAFEIECIVEGDNIWLIDVNPRFPAWIYLATGVGINLPEMLVRLALDLPLNPAEDYASGKLFVRHTHESICDMAAFQNMVTRGET